VTLEPCLDREQDTAFPTTDTSNVDNKTNIMWILWDNENKHEYYVNIEFF